MGSPSQQRLWKRVDTTENPGVIQRTGQTTGGMHYGEEIFGGSGDKKKAIWDR